MFENEKLTTEQFVAEYKDEVAKLLKYLPWLEAKQGLNVVSQYTPEAATAGTMRIPTYDGTLLAFIKVADKTKFINKNYDYVYRKYRMNNYQDELRMIARARIQDMDLLGAILSRYIIKGRTKGMMWKEGVEYGVFYAVISKMKELIEFWDVPYGEESAGE